MTGRPSLFLSPHTMERVVGMDEREGRALREELIAFTTDDRCVYRHEWEPPVLAA